MDLRLWFWLIVSCFLFRSTVTRRLRKSNSRRGLLAEVQSEMIPYTDDQAILKCITSPLATVEWLFDGEPIAIDNNNQRFTIERNKLIVHLQKKVPGDLSSFSWSQNPFKSRLFQCKATLNDETVISEPAKLIITFLDDFDPQPDRVINSVQGNTAVIPCNPPNSMPIAIMEYYVNNTLISKSDDRYLLAYSGNLQILDSRFSDSGLYRCVAFNAFLQERRNASWTVRLNVQPLNWSDPSDYPIYSPNRDESAKNIHFVVRPANETKAVMGSNVTLECVAQGIKSSPKITWFRKRNGGEKLLTNKRKSRQIAGNLLLITIDESDSGIYICRATIDDVSIETSAILDVQMTPRFTKSLRDITVNEGNNFTLECQATGNPKPRIDWFFNGKSLNSHPDNNQRFRLGLTQTEPQSQLPGIQFTDDYAKLIVATSVHSVHSGIYQCFASNELLNNDYKSTYSLAHVKVLRPGETVNDSRLSETDRSFRTDLSGVSPDNSDETNVNKAKHQEGGGRGRKRQGKAMVPPTKPKVNRLSDNSVMVYWELSNKSSLPVLFFKLQYKEVAPRSTWNTLSEDIPPHITTQTVTDLVPDSKYRFRVMAVFNNSDYKESPVSDKFHLIRTSMLKRPKDSPNIIAVVPQSQTSVEVVWDSYKESATSIEGFIIHFRATSSAGDYFQVTVPGSSKLSHIVSKLSPGTSYEFKLQCFNSAGVSEYSKILTATTFDDPVSTTTEIVTVIKGLDKNLDSRIESRKDIFLLIVGAIGLIAVSVFIVCCIIQCASRYKQNPKRRKDVPQRANGDLNNGSLIHSLHQTTQSSDEYKSETDTCSPHPDKSSINNVTASVSIDHFPNYHEEKRNNYQTRTYMIDTYCEETPYGIGCGRTGSWSRKSRRKCFETDAGVKLIATASSHNSLQRKYLYENDNHVSSTLDRRRSTFKSEEHLKCSLNARMHSKSSSFTKLDGTLERKKRRANGTTTTPSVTALSPQPPPVPERSSYLSNHRSLSSSRLNGSLEKRKKSRPDYVNTNTNTTKNGNKSTESKMNSYNGTINHINSKPPLLIMQSTC